MKATFLCSLPRPNGRAGEADVAGRGTAAGAVHVVRWVGVTLFEPRGGESFSCLLFLRKGLRFWKKPLFFSFTADMSLEDDKAEPLKSLVGEACPLVGSKLDIEVGLEYSL